MGTYKDHETLRRRHPSIHGRLYIALSSRIDRRGTNIITALDALCAIANGGFEAWERVLRESG